MKKTLCILLVLSLFLPLWGCTQPESNMKNPVNFYYCRQTLTYSGADSVISKEVRDALSNSDDYIYLLSQYLKGPVSIELQQTFPKGINLISVQIKGDTASIVLGDSFSALTGLKLTTACACLTLTVCELTGVQQVSISTETSLLDGNKAITMGLSDIVLVDDSNIAIEPD